MDFLTPGMRYMLLGTFYFSIGSLLIKVAGVRLPAMEILFFRAVIGVGLCWCIVRQAGVGMFGHRKLMLFLRGLLGLVALTAEFYSIIHLPLADALSILFSFPVVVAVFAWVLMGERLSKGGFFSIFATIAGVALVSKPAMIFGTGHNLDPFALSVSFLGVFLTAAAVLTIRSLAKTEHPAVVMLYPPMFIVLFAPLMAGDWLMPTMYEWGAVLGVGLFMNAGQYYMTKGYAIESAAKVSGVSCLEIVFAAIWGMMFLGEIPDLWTMGGAALIVLGVLVLGKSGTKAASEPEGQAE